MSKHTTFTRVALMACKNRELLAETFQATLNVLRQANIDLVVDTTTAERLHLSEIQAVPKDTLNQHADIICVVGGDGSLLQAAQTALDQQLPIIGVNRGSVGFLADIHPHNLDALISVLQGKYKSEDRFLLNVSVKHQDKSIFQAKALNDMVLHKSRAVNMIEFDTTIDDRPLCNQRADGLVVATPTGSTAYALSGGGPIIYPEQNVVVIVPMLPHKLSSRPIVINGHSCLDIHISPHNPEPPCISCDGQESFTVPLDAHIIIREESKKIQLIHPESYDYFETLRLKLGWENKPLAN